MRPLAIAALMAAHWERASKPAGNRAPRRRESTVEFAAIRAAEARAKRR